MTLATAQKRRKRKNDRTGEILTSGRVSVLGSCSMAGRLAFWRSLCRCLSSEIHHIRMVPGPTLPAERHVLLISRALTPSPAPCHSPDVILSSLRAGEFATAYTRRRGRPFGPLGDGLGSRQSALDHRTSGFDQSRRSGDRASPPPKGPARIRLGGRGVGHALAGA